MQTPNLSNEEVKLTVKDISEITGLTKHTIRYYDDQNLIPYVERDKRNIRLFSDHDLDWIKMVHSLRMSGLPIAQVKEYIDMCLQGDATIPERAHIIATQEKELEDKIQDLNVQLIHIKKKRAYYENLISEPQKDDWNPLNKNEFSCQ